MRESYFEELHSRLRSNTNIKEHSDDSKADFERRSEHWKKKKKKTYVNLKVKKKIYNNNDFARETRAKHY